MLCISFDDVHHFLRVVAAGAGHHRHLAVGRFEHELDDAAALGGAQRRRFARRAARHEEVNAGVDLPLRQPLDRRLRRARPTS